MPAPTVFIVSDGTGITAETFAHSILSQFDQKFRLVRVPFINSSEKAYATVQKINEAATLDGRRPVVFTTLVDSHSNEIVKHSNALVMDMFQTFIEPLEQELQTQSTHAIGRGHQAADTEEYKNRIEAINFSLAHDDGQSNRNLQDADVILVGVSRSGKTPTSLYLAMQYGVKAANYPLIPEDFERGKLPTPLYAHLNKIFGLSIDPQRLAEIRNERRPGSKYAALENCRYEVNEAEALMRREGIKWLSSTHKSIEEIATTILQEIKLERQSY
ncbi:posphoenolpyruvate synthetase regulatory kinase/phosphorylase PpsR [Mycetohabitans sp. B46]|uniref:posphoenolpyruvate synthetase regulatory kinase/phosphorylase PpsR n=1 Tax=Mycetohabitans sp. B46 TaxID=2772536 RepID=UPI00307D80FD